MANKLNEANDNEIVCRLDFNKRSRISVFYDICPSDRLKQGRLASRVSKVHPSIPSWWERNFVASVQYMFDDGG